MKFSERKLFQIDLLDLLNNPSSHQGADVMSSETTGQVQTHRSKKNQDITCQKPPPCTDHHARLTAENQLQSRLRESPSSLPVSSCPVRHGPETDRAGVWRSDCSPATIEPQGVRGPRCNPIHYGNTLKELQEEKIEFGKAHMGKRFIDMTTETKYMTWFTENYQHSRKLVHVKFLRFIQLWLSSQEKAGSVAKPITPKAKAKHPPREMNTPIELDSDDEVWAQLPHGSNVEMAEMRNRMGQMEIVLQEVLEHLKRTGQTPAAWRSNRLLNIRFLLWSWLTYVNHSINYSVRVHLMIQGIKLRITI